MRKIVGWLINIENRASEIYETLATKIPNDRSFAKLLNHPHNLLGDGGIRDIFLSMLYSFRRFFTIYRSFPSVHYYSYWSR